MHDPSTQAFVIPWRYRWSTLGKTPWRYWEPLITIWHRDPERDGSDDSCGWFAPKPGKIEKEIAESLAGDEVRQPWIMALSAESNPDPLQCEALVRGAFMQVSWCLRNRGRLRRPVTLNEATEWACRLVHSSIDNCRSSLCFLSGYHSKWYRKEEGVPNTPEQDKYWREDAARSFFLMIIRYIQRERRPWYRHPRWHFWHWDIQFHPAQAFKRWAFSRCCQCGGRFAWGESPYSGWNGDGGPKWFRSEKSVWHGRCEHSAKIPVGETLSSGS